MIHQPPAGSASIPPGEAEPAGMSAHREAMLRELLLTATRELGDLREACGLDQAGHDESDSSPLLFVVVTTTGVRMRPAPILKTLPPEDQRLVALEAAQALQRAADELEEVAGLD